MGYVLIVRYLLKKFLVFVNVPKIFRQIPAAYLERYTIHPALVMCLWAYSMTNKQH